MLRHALRRARPQQLLTSRARWLCSADELALPLYQSLVDCTLQGIERVVEDYADATPTQDIDVEFSGDVLNVGLGERGTFVLNKQGPNKQIWLSSPVSGPLRYDFSMDAQEWQNVRDGRPLLGMLSDDLETLIGDRVEFDSVQEEIREVVADEAR